MAPGPAPPAAPKPPAKPGPKPATGDAKGIGAKLRAKLAGKKGKPAKLDFDEEIEDEFEPVWGRRAVVTAIFLVAVGAMVHRTPDQLSHHIIGNLGDPALVIWILRWDGHAVLQSAFLHHPLGVFNAPMFSPAPHSLAYADDLLSVAPFYNALYAATQNWTLSLNVLWLGELLLNMAGTYSLTRWLTHRTEAGVLAGLAAGFSGFIWSQTGHPQLQVIGLVPIGLLLLFKLLSRPRLATALGFGLVNILILLAATYWAALYAIAVVVVVLGWQVAQKKAPTRRLIGSLVVAGLVTALAAPTFWPYHLVQQVEPKRPLAPVWSLHPRDIIRPTPQSYLYPTLAGDNAPGTNERHDFPGFLTMALAAVGLGSLALSYRRKPGRAPQAKAARHRPKVPGRQAEQSSAEPPATMPMRTTPVPGAKPAQPAAATDWLSSSRSTPIPDPPDRRRYVVLLCVVGVVALVLAFGAPGGLWTPWRLFYNYVPGFDGVRVTARFAAFTLLAGAVLAGLGLDVILRHLPKAWLRVIVAIVACGVILLELAGPQYYDTLPSDTATLAVYNALRAKPPGVVAELPMADPYGDVHRWSFTEPVRMVWASLDWHPRLNGYSGYFPPTYPDDATVLATLPAPAAQARLAQRHVRYLIVHTGMQAGWPMFTTQQATDLINGLGPNVVATQYGPNYLVDLTPSQGLATAPPPKGST